MQARLIAIAEPFEGSSFHLGGQESIIGRDGANDICLEDSAVSRKHCAITYDGVGFELHDFGTRNLTFINGLPGETGPLR